MNAPREESASSDAKQRLVFCDEFGNTGANLGDEDQPVFVYAFVVIPSSAVLRLDAQIADIYAREGLTRAEMKSTVLCASRAGRRRIAAIGNATAASGARVVLSVVEKRYQACSMIVETYLDPLQSERAPPEMLGMEARQAFADACYECLSDRRLAEFLEAVREDEVDRIESVGERISATLRLHPSGFISDAAARMETRPGRVFRYSKPREILPGGRLTPASQYAAFYPGLAKVESLLEDTDVDANLVRDEDRHFGAFLDLAFSIAKGLRPSLESVVYGAAPLTRLLTCTASNSEVEVGVQLADLAAGAFGRAVRDAIRGRKGGATRAPLQGWLGVILPREWHYWMVSDAQCPAVLEAVYGNPTQSDRT